jgi:hypothetical protein
MKRVSSPGKYNATLNDYLREVHCVCPKCAGNAVITASSKYALPWQPFDVSLVCHTCLHREAWPSSNWQSDFINYNPANGIEPYFGYTLLLQISIKGQSFSVFSPAHAVDIAEYIEATDRPSPANSKWSMVNRLPKWVKLARNREAVLQALNKLKSQSAGMP